MYFKLQLITSRNRAVEEENSEKLWIGWSFERHAHRKSFAFSSVWTETDSESLSIMQNTFVVSHLLPSTLFSHFKASKFALIWMKCKTFEALSMPNDSILDTTVVVAHFLKHNHHNLCHFPSYITIWFDFDYQHQPHHHENVSLMINFFLLIDRNNLIDIVRAEFVSSKKVKRWVNLWTGKTNRINENVIGTEWQDWTLNMSRSLKCSLVDVCFWLDMNDKQVTSKLF